MSLLRVENITKSFPGVHALKGIDLEIYSGEIHALMGENGAGKSTFIKVLTGIYQRDAGKIFLENKEVNFKTPMEANIGGISTVYQELNLIPYQAVYENLFLGREPVNKLGAVDRAKMIEESERILSELGVKIDVNIPLKNYSTAVQQMVAIARAVNMRAKLLILDEPTSSLDKKEVEILFEIMRKLKNSGMGIIFISHKLDEIYEITDRISILKDGEFEGAYKTEDISQLELVSKMVGRDTKVLERQKHGYAFDFADELVRIKNAGQGVKLKGINLDIKKGEVVGLAGLLGSGRTETARILFGVEKPEFGDIIWLNRKEIIRKPSDAIGLGMGYCTEDRKTEGIIQHLSVKENITVALLPKLNKFGFVDQKRQDEIADKYIKRLNIKTPTMEQAVGNLSGGNQQKVLLARWMCTDPKLIILDEPTRGIDVGAKAEVENLIGEFSKAGISVLMISSEIAELERNCDRIFVVRDGRISGSLKGEEISGDGILNLIAGRRAEENE